VRTSLRRGRNAGEARSSAVELANGVKTVYKFIDPAETLKKGDKVNRGQVIGTVAAPTGIENKDGAHLHFEIYKDGKLAELEDYLDVNEK